MPHARTRRFLKEVVANMEPWPDKVRPMASTEHSINDVLAAILRTKRHLWNTPGVVRSEDTATLEGSEKRPDILIVEPNVGPVVIETEVVPATTVEKEARERLGHHLRATHRTIFSSIAVRLPKRLRKLDGSQLTTELRGAEDLEFVLFTGPDPIHRWPGHGWLKGGVEQLSIVAESAAVPPSVIEQAADWLVQGVSAAAGQLEDIAAKFKSVTKKIGGALHQEDNEQTRRMAMTIIANAFIFHESLAGTGGQLENIRTIDEIRSAGGGRLLKPEVLAEWSKILKVNFWPIFDIARRIVEFLPVEPASEILETLAQTAARLLANRLARSHDLTGAVFQKLIADRKFLAAFYTTPPSATMLVGLALTPDATPAGGDWKDRRHIEALRVADFACGTGTLLSATYHRIAQLHELTGGNAEKLHPTMMAQVLVGCDVLPAAAHLTASMLSAVHPSVRYEKSSIMTVPYGIQKDRTIALGSLDLLQEQATFSLLSLSTLAKAAGGTGEHEANTWAELPHSAFDLVIMNPPFTRATGHEAQKVGVPVPMFAAFGAEEDEQRAMSKALEKLTRETSAHGNAGEASIFLVLADKKLKENGRLALVMPLSILAGDAWEKSRQLLRRSYRDLIIVTIAGRSDNESSFSADTGMGECLIVASKKARGPVKSGAPARACFVVLNQRPTHQLPASETARRVHQAIASGQLSNLEDGPVGGTQLHIGDDTVGNLIDGPLPETGPWPLSRIADFSIAQVAFELTSHSRLWLPAMNEASAVKIPIANLQTNAVIGPYHMDISGKERSGGAVRGPFDVVALPVGRVATYPMLWAHDADQERAMEVVPDTEGVIRKGNNKAEADLIRERADSIWKTASNVHLNRDFRFNSQSVAAAWTADPCIGGRAWPSASFGRPEHSRAFTLWCNSTLGLLLYWWIANKQQAGRGSVTISALPDLPALDVKSLSEVQLKASERVFEDLKNKGMRPFNEIDVDAVRHELDRRLLVDVLGVDSALLTPDGPLQRLRRKLSHEPSIRGGKE